MGRLIPIGLALLISAPLEASILTYTQTQTGADLQPLGLPVPMPQTSSTAFAGFRHYDSLIDHLSLLALQRPELRRIDTLGRSLDDRPIHSFAFGQSGQPAVLHSGGIHAREWASQEAVAHVIETLAAGLDGRGIPRYLADHLHLLFVPVLNPDALLATQNHPDQTRVEEDPAGVADTPRDGRMRRKNLRDSDGVLDSAADALFGVDLNRNIGPYWARSAQSSADPRSIVHHGGSEGSEPETAMLKAAAALAGADKLRLYIDTHSFGRVWIHNNTANDRLNLLTRELADTIRGVPNEAYARQAADFDQGIGATDEFFGYEVQVPAYTLEIEPRSSLAEYGGEHFSHSGFILPEAEVPRMREEVFLMSQLAYYHQAGPPHLAELRIVDAEDETLVFHARWADEDAGRRLDTLVDMPLIADHPHRAVLRFSKPMRLRGQDGELRAYPGQQAVTDPAFRPTIRLRGANNRVVAFDTPGDWQDGIYEADSYALDLPPCPQLGETAGWEVSARDLSGHALDSQPASRAGWSQGHWVNYEDDSGLAGDSGGADRNLSIHFEAASACGQAGGGGGSGSPALWLLIALLGAGRVRRRTRIAT